MTGSVSIFQGCTETCGWMAAVIAVLAWGSFGVPIKLAAATNKNNNNNARGTTPVPDIQVNFLVMQTYKTFTCFLTCWLVLFMGEEVKWSNWGIASGLFWVPGASCGVYAIRNAGLATAVGTWSSIQVLTSFVFGILIFQERVKSLPRTCLAFVTLTIGLVGMSRYAGMGNNSAPPPPKSAAASVALATAPISDKNAAASDRGTSKIATSLSTKSPTGASSINSRNNTTSTGTFLYAGKPSLSDGPSHNMMGSGKRERGSLVRKNVKTRIRKTSIVESDDCPTIPTRDERKNKNSPASGGINSRLFVVGIDDVKKLIPLSSPAAIAAALSSPPPPSGGASSIRMVPAMEMETSSSTGGGGRGCLDDESLVMMGSNKSIFSNDNPQHQRLLDDFDPYDSDNDDNDEMDNDKSRRKRKHVQRVVCDDVVLLCGGRIMLTRRQLGVLGAVVNGAWGGCNLIPMHYAQRDDGLKGASYLISYACGSMIVNIAIFVLLFLYYLYQRNGHVQEAVEALPKFHFQHLWFPGLCTGLCYSLGNFCSILAVTYLGQGTGFSFCQMNLFVSGLWAVFYFHEIQGAECITKWFLSATVALTGIIWLSYEHEEGGAIGH